MSLQVAYRGPSRDASMSSATLALWATGGDEIRFSTVDDALLIGGLTVDEQILMWRGSSSPEPGGVHEHRPVPSVMLAQ